MTPLPIVGRELRVAARKRGTYWSRVIAAAVALVIFGAVALIDALSPGGLGNQVGVYLFQVFSWLCFLLVLVAGVFFTSDALSEEKREGTLGLLFLTDLRGHDVVLGKLMAGSLRGAYGLVAALPVVGLSFLLGGLTGGEFWRLVVTLLNTLFFTLAIGMAVSAVSRQGQRAMFATLGVVLAFVGLTWLADWALAGWDPARFKNFFSLASPVKGFLHLRASRYDAFWQCMGIIHGLGWVFLALACFCAPRTWQEKSASGGKGRRWKWLGTAASRVAWRRRLFEGNPVRWVAARERWSAWAGGAGLLVLLLVLAWLARDLWVDGQLMWMTMVLGWLLSFVLVLSLSSHACRFFVEARSSGALELMLAAPLPEGAIVRAQWWALVRMFWLPVVVVLALRIAGSVQQLVQFWTMSAASQPGWPGDHMLTRLLGLGLSVLKFVTSLLAMGWFGMWMGVTTRRANVAVLKSIAFVYVLPTLALWFLNMMFMVGLSMINLSAGGGFMPLWLPELLMGALALGLDVFFFLLARRKLLGNFRGLVASAAGVALKTAPPPLPAPPPLAVPH